MTKVVKLFLVLVITNLQILKAQITVSADSATVGMYNVYELTINHPVNYSNNWEDVNVAVVFSGPETIHINGFFYDTNIWKVRFAPPDTGAWSYAITFSTPTTVYTSTGTFSCIPSATKGFLRKHPNNPFRLIFPDGTLFNSVGFEDCVLDFNGDGTPLDDFGFDGGFYPPNTLGSRTTLDKYMNAYGVNGAKFNLFRWTTNNCSFGLYNTITTSGNTYLTKEGMFGDTLVRSLRANNIRIWLTFFGPPVFNDINGSEPLEDAAIERYVNYIVARYGAYVDIWELFNESSASNYYYNTISAYLRSIDPYHRLISVSDQQPQLACIDINSPHWYQKESELVSDIDAYNMITSRKSYNKPIIFGEQGNSVQNWDTLSSVRMRLRAWASFFAEGTLIFWNTSVCKNYMAAVAANIYLGPTERGYISALQYFTAFADTSTTQIKLTPQNPSQVRAYGLGSQRMTFGYFVHYNTHANNVSTAFTIRLPRDGRISWINPADNSIVKTDSVSYGDQTISSPPFEIDLAMRIVLSDKEPVFNEQQKLNFIVYPNPAFSEFAVDGNFNGTAIVELYSVDGKRVFANSNIDNDEKINIENLPNGVYICRVTSNQRVAAAKLVIAHQ
jgi:hypothetical protein